jgi:putative hydrolase of the HAD superfamily
MTTPFVILLDGHGTLTHPIRDRLTIYQQLCQQHNITCSTEKIKEQISVMKKEHYLFLTTTMERDGFIKWDDDKKEWFSLEAVLFKNIGLHGNYEEISFDLLADFMNPKQQCLYNDVLLFLEQAKKQNIPLGIVSNSDSRYIQVLEYHGILPYFEHCILSSEVRYKKPGKQIFIEAAKVFSTPLASCVYIGDQYLLDVKAGIDAGIKHSYLIQREKTSVQPECVTLKTLLDIFTYIS